MGLLFWVFCVLFGGFVVVGGFCCFVCFVLRIGCVFLIALLVCFVGWWADLFVLMFWFLIVLVV